MYNVTGDEPTCTLYYCVYFRNSPKYKKCISYIDCSTSYNFPLNFIPRREILLKYFLRSISGFYYQAMSEDAKLWYLNCHPENHENKHIFPITRGFRMNISIKLIDQYMTIFFNLSPTLNHHHPLQVENCP